jgi:hypothetical protein
MPGQGFPQPDLLFASLQTALRLRPRRALSSAGDHQNIMLLLANKRVPIEVRFYARPVLLTTKCPLLLTTAVRFCSHRDNILSSD